MIQGLMYCATVCGNTPGFHDMTRSHVFVLQGSGSYPAPPSKVLFRTVALIARRSLCPEPARSLDQWDMLSERDASPDCSVYCTA